MARSKIAGITGVLGDLMSPSQSPAVSPKGEGIPPHSDAAPTETHRSGPSPPRPRKSARVGRPPRSAVGCSRPKEKVTLRISSELIAEYRDWSWEARCQLGELVEQALVAYRRNGSLRRESTD